MRRLLILLMAFWAISCSPTSKGGGGEADTPVAPQYRLTVDGKPFLMLGAQLRTDFFRDLDHKGYDELDIYFSLAASLNITVVQIAVPWSYVETGYDEYTDEAVRAYIDYCEKYGLKAEFLWFGSYMCGYSVAGYIPDYVVSDPTTYPRFNGGWDGWLGWTFYLKPGTSALLARESKAMGKMMEFIDEYDRQLGCPHTVIGIQVENEPDMLASRHYSVLNMSSTDLWPGLLHHIEVIGKAVKESPYDCYTRVNMTLDEGYDRWAPQVAKRDGIDYVGLDPYVSDVDRIGSLMDFLGTIPGNFPHVAENGGEYYNNDVMTLKALSKGAGYEVFEVVTTPDPQLADWTLRGVYNPDFTPKGQTQRLINAYAIFKGAWYDFATAAVGNIHPFNVVKSEGQENTSETAQLASGTLTWSTTSRGIAFAIEGDGYITAASTKADRMTFSTAPRSAEKGHYDKDGKWLPAGSVQFDGGTLSMEAGIIYRITP